MQQDFGKDIELLDNLFYGSKFIEKLIFAREWKYLDIEVSLLCWGLGFDIGYAYRLAMSLWIGPVYIEIHN